jgi:CBS-domain-containing membrane protein
MVILPYGIKEELFDKAVKVIGSFMAIPIIGIILGFVFLVKFFGTYHGAFGIFVFALPIGWLLGQSVITENFLAVILGLICFVIGVLVKFFLREKEKIANEI